MLHCHLLGVWDCAGGFWHDFTVLLQQSHDADSSTFRILQMRKLAPPHLCFGQSWLFPEASYPSLAQPWQPTQSDLARVRAVELNTWAGMQSSHQQEFNEVGEVCSLTASQIPRFPSPGCGCLLSLRLCWNQLVPHASTPGNQGSFKDK